MKPGLSMMRLFLLLTLFVFSSFVHLFAQNDLSFEKKRKLLSWQEPVEKHLLHTNLNSHAKPEMDGYGAWVNFGYYIKNLTMVNRLKYAEATLERIEKNNLASSHVTHRAVRNDMAMYYRYMGKYMEAYKLITEVIEDTPSIKTLTDVETHLIYGLISYDLLLTDRCLASFKKVLIPAVRYLDRKDIVELIEDGIQALENTSLKRASLRESSQDGANTEWDENGWLAKMGYTQEDMQGVLQQVYGGAAYSNVVTSGRKNLFYLANMNEAFLLAIDKRNVQEVRGLSHQLSKDFSQFMKDNLGWFNTSSNVVMRSLLDKLTDNMLRSISLFPGDQEIVSNLLNFRINTRGMLSTETRNRNRILSEKAATEELNQWRMLLENYSRFAFFSLKDPSATDQREQALLRLDNYETDLFIKYYEPAPPEEDRSTEAIRQQLIDAYMERMKKEYGPYAAIMKGKVEQIVDQELAQSKIGEEVAVDFVMWEEVHSQLSEREAIVDIIKYKSTSGMTAYGAIVLKRDSAPKFVPLGNEETLKKYLFAHKGAIIDFLTDSKSYRSLFKPLGLNEKDLDAIYLMTEGLFSDVNFNAIYNPTTEKYLIETTNIRVLYSLANLLTQKQKQSWNHEIMLIGNPEFGTEKSFFEEPMGYLPGTANEVQAIDSLLEGKWNTTLLQGDHVRMSALLQMRSPDVLHIATHGFFLEEYIQEDERVDPLIVGGLALAGANEYDPLNQADDHYLNAKEVIGLDLSQTKLVVLSACQTGLGSETYGEGIEGLQSAFIMAGSQSVIGTLWPVADLITADFMVLMYDNLNKSNSTADLVRKTTLEFFKKYPDKRMMPYFWGPFVQLN